MSTNNLSFGKNPDFFQSYLVDDISDIFVIFVFQSGRDYQLCVGHISFIICNY